MRSWKERKCGRGRFTWRLPRCSLISYNGVVMIDDVELSALPTRFRDKIFIEPNSGCWLWMGQMFRNGYGKQKTLVRENGYPRRWLLVHRFVYEYFRGPIPSELQIDHLCRIRGCCNPSHLEAVSAKVNTRRGPRASVTHCRYGHPYDQKNTYVNRTKRGDMRLCRECHRLQEAARRKAKRLASA